ncbi:MAG: outer membrane protein assembly factor [Bacteroidales bacterium]|nr:outer membrane protein assembly factor [Bacteroidales bacterium]
MVKYIIFFLGLFVLTNTYAFSPEPDKIDSTKKDKNLKFSILGGPGYTPDFGLLLGGSALFTFKTNPKDTVIERSVVPIGFAVMFSGGFNLISRPQFFYNQDRFRIFGQVIVKNTLDNYYGIGYDTNNSLERGEDITQYRASNWQINPILLWRLGQTDFFGGPLIDLSRDYMKDPSEGVMNDPSYIAQGGDESGLISLNTGVGLTLSYDTRDIPANAYEGLLLDFKTTFFLDELGGDSDYTLINFEYRQFTLLEFMGPRRSFGWMLKSSNSFGDVPITRMQMIGSPFDIRGYYLGQYRDKSAHFGLAEYRHMFNSDKQNLWGKLYNRLGLAAWGGVGFMGPDLGNVEAVLPNFGAGLRIEVQPRMNFRIDVGHNPVDNLTLVYFNMTEAF